jgi:3-dehydroquinate synthase
MDSLHTPQYPIHFGLEHLRGIQPGRRMAKLVVLCDSNTKDLCYPLLAPMLDNHEMVWVPAGEASKSLAMVEELIGKLSFRFADRHSILLNLGGGVVSDLGGLTASLYHRGIPFVNVPTTLLAMLDATIGGKTGVNVRGGKNLAGTFNNPQSVHIHLDFLKTLPERELKAGYAEALKHALIADAAHWRDLTSDGFPPANLPGLIRRSLEIKLAIVEQDPFEKGPRKALNFGHTLGHALEGLMLDRGVDLLHGEAVAAGMVMEAWLSWKTDRLSEDDYLEIRRYLLLHFGKVALRDHDEVLLATRTHLDKKNFGQRLRFSLLRGIGDCEVDAVVEPDMVTDAIQAYQAP